MLSGLADHINLRSVGNALRMSLRRRMVSTADFSLVFTYPIAYPPTGTTNSARLFLAAFEIEFSVSVAIVLAAVSEVTAVESEAESATVRSSILTSLVLLKRAASCHCIWICSGI